MKLIPCKSCGAPLAKNKCAYCGAFHFADGKFESLQYLVPSDMPAENIQAIQNLPLHGWAIVNPEWIARVEIV